MHRIIAKNLTLFLCYLLIMATCGILLTILGKAQLHLFLTAFHSAFLEQLMKIFTWLGDGLFMIVIGLLLLIKSFRYGLTILGSFIVSSLVVQMLKRLVFPDFKRPVAWFQELGIEIYKVGGMEYHSAFSFPSGHTTTAFALFFGLAFFVKNAFLKIIFLSLAVITGFSRIYLSQHFMGDVLAGSILGVVTVMLIFSWLNKMENKWLDKNILSLFGKKDA